MAALTIGAVAAKAVTFVRLPDERMAEDRRTVNGQLRGRSGWLKRGWSAELVAETGPELTALLAVLDADAAATVTGDLLGGASASCKFTRGEITTVRRFPGGWFWTLPVTMREV